MEKNLVQKLALVQQELKAPKSQFNSFGNYKYRNQEDILEAVKPLLAKHGLGLRIYDEVKFIGNRYYIQATAQLSDLEAKDRDYLTVTGLAREEEVKRGMDASQITGAASSYARKYALNGLFLIDDTKDSDYTNGIDPTLSSRPTPAVKPAVVSTPKVEVEQPKPAVTTANNVSSPAFKCSKCSKAITTAEKVYSKLQYGQELCRDCQKTSTKIEKKKVETISSKESIEVWDEILKDERFE
jgi:hypothetical protein